MRAPLQGLAHAAAPQSGDSVLQGRSVALLSPPASATCLPCPSRAGRPSAREGAARAPGQPSGQRPRLLAPASRRSPPAPPPQPVGPGSAAVLHRAPRLRWLGPDRRSACRLLRACRGPGRLPATRLGPDRRRPCGLLGGGRSPGRLPAARLRCCRCGSRQRHRARCIRRRWHARPDFGAPRRMRDHRLRCRRRRSTPPCGRHCIHARRRRRRHVRPGAAGLRNARPGKGAPGRANSAPLPRSATPVPAISGAAITLAAAAAGTPRSRPSPGRGSVR